MTQTVILTGGSGGIGLACARALAARGARVALVGRDPDGLARAAAHLPPEQVLTVAADVTQAADVARMMDEVLAWSPRLDVLVNNAGAAAIGRVATFPVDEWERLLAVNLTSVFLCSRAVIPHMRTHGGGLIVNVGSLAGKQAFPEWSAYCAAKFGLVGFTRALQQEVRSDGIRVTLVSPGSVDTPLWDTFPNTFDRQAMLKTEDVAAAITYVAAQPPHVVIDELSLGHSGGAQ